MVVATDYNGPKHMWVIIEHEIGHPRLVVDVVDHGENYGAETVWFVINRSVAPQVMPVINKVADGRLVVMEKVAGFDSFDWVFMRCDV